VIQSPKAALPDDRLTPALCPKGMMHAPAPVGATLVSPRSSQDPGDTSVAPTAGSRGSTELAEVPRHGGAWRMVFMALVILMAPITTRADETLDGQLDASIERGLAFLARHQNREGAFEGGGPKAAMTGLGLMSFMAAGHGPDVGKHGLVVRNAIDYLVKIAPQNGYFGDVDGSRMYGHGIITLALAEAYGLETDSARRARLREVLARAVKVILDAQAVPKDAHHKGGWRYERGSGDSDLSLSGWNALALRACQNIGLDVPREPIDRAVAYVLRCYRKEEPRGFCYQPGREATPGMTGVGVLNLYLLSQQVHESADASRKLLAESKAQESRFPYYTLYYVTQAAFQLGEPTWSTVWKRTREHLVSQQLDDGGWPVSKQGEEPGRLYATSMSVLTLAVPYRVLPIYQR
jgi:hypothetical protein